MLRSIYEEARLANAEDLLHGHDEFLISSFRRIMGLRAYGFHVWKSANLRPHQVPTGLSFHSKYAPRLPNAFDHKRRVELKEKTQLLFQSGFQQVLQRS
eukprot:1100151-Amphidinium_carterae.3